jgi:hypothetical protein
MFYEFLHAPRGLLATSHVLNEAAEHLKQKPFDRSLAFLEAA